jgi:hypothetical protein
MAGLIAANYFRKRSPVVYERQESLPNNHRALLRFRTAEIATITGIPFRQVLVHKEISTDGGNATGPTFSVANAYSLKTTGEVHSRSVWNLSSEHRYIAPSDFIPLLARGVDCDFGRPFTLDVLPDDGSSVISTIPMPDLMSVVGWNETPEFSYRPIWAINVEIAEPPIDVYQTVYFPDLGIPLYRASITGSHLILEFIEEPEEPDRWVTTACNEFGLPRRILRFTDTPTCVRQKYGKIVPIDEGLRQEFIYSMTRDYGIYSLGRYATWRQILLDDLAKDLSIIETLTNAEERRRSYQHSISARR